MWPSVAESGLPLLQIGSIRYWMRYSALRFNTAKRLVKSHLAEFEPLSHSKLAQLWVAINAASRPPLPRRPVAKPRAVFF